MTESSEAVGEVLEQKMAENGTNGAANTNGNGKVCRKSNTAKDEPLLVEKEANENGALFLIAKPFSAEIFRETLSEYIQ